MPLPRFYKLSEEKRRHILGAARSEFAARGLEGASFNRIIASAGISKGAMYYYFADKADAYNAVIDDVLAEVRAVVTRVEAPRDAAAFWRAIDQGTATLMATFAHDEELAGLLRGIYRGQDDVLRELTARVDDWVEALLARGQQLGAVRDDLPLELLARATSGLLVSVDRWFAEAMERDGLEALMPLVPNTLALIRDLLQPRPPLEPTA